MPMGASPYGTGAGIATVLAAAACAGGFGEVAAVVRLCVSRGGSESGAFVPDGGSFAAAVASSVASGAAVAGACAAGGVSGGEASPGVAGGGGALHAPVTRARRR